LKNVTDKNAEWYMAQLMLGSDVMLDQDAIQSAVNVSNANAERHNKCKFSRDVKNG
jgi:succinate dehydrogenase/fumarate reductase flavoprotein subunit